MPTIEKMKKKLEKDFLATIKKCKTVFILADACTKPFMLFCRSKNNASKNKNSLIAV